MKKLKIISILVCLFTISKAQQATWLFGPNAGLRFNGSNVSQLSSSSLTTGEGASVAHDQDGELLFYTNGVTVWNADHVPQDMGLGADGLGGGSSSTQCALIIPVNGKYCTQFFVFVVDQVEDLREISTPNVPYKLPSVFLLEVNRTSKVVSRLAGPTVLFNDYSSEKLCATSDGNGGYWVLLHNWGTINSDKFHAFHVTKNTKTLSEIVSTHVASNVGSNHFLSSGWNFGSVNNLQAPTDDQAPETMQGQMQFSPDGNLVALVVSKKNILECFDFNKTNGHLTLKFSRKRNQLTGTSEGELNFLYGLEFSPDSKNIYTSDGFTRVKSRVMRVSVDNPNSINNSVHTTDQNGSGRMYYGKMELGPDDKIYVVRPSTSPEYPNHLNRINDPDNISNPDYKDEFTFSGTLGACLPTIAANSFDCSAEECKCLGAVEDPSLNMPSLMTVPPNMDGSLRFKINSAGKQIRKIKVTLIKAFITGPIPFYTPRDITNELTLKTYSLAGFERISNGKTVTFTKNGEGGIAFNSYLNIPVKWNPPLTTPLCWFVPDVSYCFEVELISVDCEYCSSEMCEGDFPAGDIYNGGDGTYNPDPDIQPFLSPKTINFEYEIQNYNPNKNSGLTVFPNPTENVLNITMNSDGQKVINIVSLDGKVVEIINTLENNLSIETYKYKPGVYYIMVYQNGKVETEKFVKGQTKE